jgi:hypothetical protein
VTLQTLIAANTVLAARAQRKPATPAALAVRVMRNYRVTPAIALMSDLLTEAIREPDLRLVISTPPRTGKSHLVSRAAVLLALSEDPDTEVVLASHSDTLAQEHSHATRAMVAEHSDLLGFKLSSDKTAVGRWKVAGREGGLLAAGIMSGITGFGADFLIVDDPIKNAQEADSAAHRRRLISEFQSTLMTRLHPGASVVVVGTRWHEQDLIGYLLDNEPGRWRHINIPAVSEDRIPDALERRPGVAMTSALGRTAAAFDDIKRTVGTRAWYAMFQGVPSSPEGGLVKREWLNTNRLLVPPAAAMTVVGVDPSDSGSGDSCGIVAASSGPDGRVAMIADVSAPMTSDQWAQTAVDLAIAVGAGEIAVESFAARETYQRVVRDALARSKTSKRISVTAWPPKGSGRGGGDAMARSSALLQGLEVGTVRLAGHFPRFEEQAIAWQSGQHQPDGLAALVVAHDVLVHAGGTEWSIASPLGTSLTQGRTAPGPETAGGSVTSMDEWFKRRVS